jgi:Uma2 family endonuclease
VRSEYREGGFETFEPRPLRWTREEYILASEAGVFLERRVQLIGGEIIEMPAQKNWHAMGITMVADALRLAFGANVWVRVQMTLDLSPHSLPDPDVAVIPGALQSHPPTGIPTSALLVVEVSETTLSFDRNHKACLYAACGIADYWVLNLVDRQLEVYRDPVADPARPFGHRYDSRTDLGPADAVTPLALPAARIAVADLLP